MRFAACIAILFVLPVSYTFSRADTTESKLKAGAIFSINSNGIAPVPAFSLDKPALSASVSLVKNRFSYEPMLAYGLDMKLWILDNWLRYKIINRSLFEFRLGVDFSSFYSNYKLPDETILKGERYFAFEVAGVYKPSQSSSVTLEYWSDNGQEKESLQGHFVNLIADRSDISVGRHLLMGANIQFFYINYNGNNDGLFISPKWSLGARHFPFSIYFQATQAIFSNIYPFPGFRWNVGLAYSL